MIRLTAYAKMINKSPSSVREMVQKGKLKTAKKINNVWYIDENEPFPERHRYKDLTGQRFGSLVARKYLRTNQFGVSVWLCDCDCGKQKNVTANNLRTGYTKSCGCIGNGAKETDVMGKKYGLLTPIEPIAKKDSHNSTLWKCECDCGEITYASVRNLISTKVTSCGCKKTLSGKKMYKVATEAAKKSPKSGRFETNINAKEWHLVSPDGKHYKFKSLKNWARNSHELFGFENTDKDIKKICAGIYHAKAGVKGKPYSNACTYKDWRVIID